MWWRYQAISAADVIDLRITLCANKSPVIGVACSGVCERVRDAPIDDAACVQRCHSMKNTKPKMGRGKYPRKPKVNVSHQTLEALKGLKHNKRGLQHNSFIHSGYLCSALLRNLLIGAGALSPATANIGPIDF